MNAKLFLSFLFVSLNLNASSLLASSVPQPLPVYHTPINTNTNVVSTHFKCGSAIILSFIGAVTIAQVSESPKLLTMGIALPMITSLFVYFKYLRS